MFDHYIAVDWSQKTMAIARMTKSSGKVTVVEVPADIKELKFYLSRLKGTKVLAFEESGPAQWLYTELRGLVEELIVCYSVKKSTRRGLLKMPWQEGWLHFLWEF